MAFVFMYISFLAKKPQTSWKTGWKHWISDLCRIGKFHLVNKHHLLIWLADENPQLLVCVKLRKFFTYSCILFPFVIYRNAVKQNEFWCSVINKSGVHNIDKEKNDMQKNMQNGRRFVKAVNMQILTWIHNLITDSPRDFKGNSCSTEAKHV